MKMDGEIRVKTDKAHGFLYNELKNCVVGEFHELFFICACLGFKNKKAKALGTEKDPRFWSSTIKPREWACYYAMILEENEMDFQSVQDDKQVISRIEEYANGGLNLLIEDFLKDYLMHNSTDIQIDQSVSRELPKTFLHYIYDLTDYDVVD